ncbi:hypothetical protein SAMN05880501_10768 [Ureibacillus xyleni]|uniref:Uncharacterized protein n=1 Tax=Ureibacillus xyleni TaxID=614648 RepID=A0A285SXV4_9BACL|nr:hypothetical protein [Ureibacillus xyleni]SOC12883.1 hypothetical protein SAMN05880501_10768 [Ureibacillus xyleni]
MEQKRLNKIDELIKEQERLLAKIEENLIKQGIDVDKHKDKSSEQLLAEIKQLLD